MSGMGSDFEVLTVLERGGARMVPWLRIHEFYWGLLEGVRAAPLEGKGLSPSSSSWRNRLGCSSDLSCMNGSRLGCCERSNAR